MKIGILTFHLTTNYGALFQAYALRKFLQDEGHDVEFVNYQPSYLEEGGKIKLNTLFTKSTITILYVKFVTFREKYFGNKQKKESFKEFTKKYLGINDELIYKNKESLEKANLYYDLLITGSDQVWNPPKQFGIDHVFFLDFKTANPNVKKISYAPSFGKNSLDAEYENEVGKLISKLDAISIREKSGVDIINKIASLNATLVPDPTILLTNYKNIFKKYNIKNKKYIFCYYLRSRDVIGEIAEYISEKNNLSIYSPDNPNRRWKEIGETVFPGPQEWLYLMHNSNFVITNSFHGTMLSILLNKPFITVGIGKRKEYNERALNILQQCGLENRFVDEYNEKIIERLRNEDIDWNKVMENIDLLKQEAIRYLTTSINK